MAQKEAVSSLLTVTLSLFVQKASGTYLAEHALPSSQVPGETTSAAAAASQARLCLASAEAARCLVDAAPALLSPPSFRTPRETHSPGTSSSLAAAFRTAPAVGAAARQQHLGWLLLQVLSVPGLGTAVMRQAPSSSAFSRFRQACWGAVAALAGLFPGDAVAVLGADRGAVAEGGAAALVELFESAGHQVATAKGAARERPSPLAAAFAASAPVLAAMIGGQAVAPRPAPATRRRIYEAAAAAAWAAFEDSLVFKPSVADALARLIFQPSFFQDGALTGLEDGPSASEEGQGANLLSLFLGKFEQLASRGRPHVLRAAVARWELFQV